MSEFDVPFDASHVARADLKVLGAVTVRLNAIAQVSQRPARAQAGLFLEARLDSCWHSRVLHHECGLTQLRRAEPSDSAFLVSMARLACTLADRPLPVADDSEVLEVLPSNSDVALIATVGDGQPVGAAWRHLHAPPLLRDPGGRALPELVVAVAEHARGRGVGALLIDALAQEATGRFGALTLNVHLLNPAVRLYVRAGFRVAGAGRGWYGVAMSRTLVAKQ